MTNLKVFEINFYYLIVGESEEQVREFFRLLTKEKIERIRECSIEKEGFVVFNEDTYKMKTFNHVLDSLLKEQESINLPFVLRAKPLNR